MDQYVNLGQLVWPGLVLVVIGAGLLYFQRPPTGKDGSKSGGKVVRALLSILGVAFLFAGVSLGLLAFHVVDATFATLVAMIVVLLVGLRLLRSHLVVGLVVVVLSLLALVALVTTYIPNFQFGQSFRDLINFVTQGITQLLHLSDQGLGQLQQ